jgi:hypothetical protein
MTGPGEEAAAQAGRDRDRLRASDADREQVVGALQSAFVQGRLTQDELSTRADQVYTARTYAELSEAIADIPTELNGTRPARNPWRATKRAWRFEYAAFLPGIAAVLLLPSGPHTTAATLAIYAAVIYPVFWVAGVGMTIAKRRAGPPGGHQSWPLPNEQVMATLKAALAQGRLTEEEFGERAARLPAVRVPSAQRRAAQNALTADLPAGLAARLPRTRHAWTGACGSMAAVSVLAALFYLGPDSYPAFALALLCAALLILGPPITVGLAVDARHQKRAGRQLRLGTAPGAGG